MFLHVGSEDSDQTGWMPRLIRVFAGRTLILLVLSCRGSYRVMLLKKKEAHFICYDSLINCFFDTI